MPRENQKKRRLLLEWEKIADGIFMSSQKIAAASGVEAKKQCFVFGFVR